MADLPIGSIARERKWNVSYLLVVVVFVDNRVSVPATACHVLVVSRNSIEALLSNSVINFDGLMMFLVLWCESHRFASVLIWLTGGGIQFFCWIIHSLGSEISHRTVMLPLQGGMVVFQKQNLHQSRMKEKLTNGKLAERRYDAGRMPANSKAQMNDAGKWIFVN